MYIYRTAHQSGQILQREFPAWPHSLWGHRAVLVRTYTIFSSWAAPQPWWFPSTRVCLVVCFSEQTFTFLIHRPLEEGWGHEGDWCDPFFVEGFLVALFRHRIWNQRSPRSLFFSSHLAEAEFWKKKPQILLFPRRNLLWKTISRGTDSGCLTPDHSRCKPSFLRLPAS